MGATLGGGSNTVFGAGGADRFIVRLTTGVAIAFMVTTIILVNIFSTYTAFDQQGAAPSHPLIEELEKELASKQPDTNVTDTKTESVTNEEAASKPASDSAPPTEASSQ